MFSLRQLKKLLFGLTKEELAQMEPEVVKVLNGILNNPQQIKLAIKFLKNDWNPL